MGFELWTAPLALGALQGPLILFAIGLSLFAVGLLHRVPTVARWDARTFMALQALLRGSVPLFRLAWHLGRTPFALALLAVAFLPGWRAGLMTSLAYAAAIGIERMIKLTWKRPRPSERLGGVPMHQPRLPQDPSYPSGDALRVWFFAPVMVVLFQVPPLPAVAIGLTAALVSLGRVALGVHYPLDVLGGIGLGTAAAGAVLIALRSTGVA